MLTRSSLKVIVSSSPLLENYSRTILKFWNFQDVRNIFRKSSPIHPKPLPKCPQTYPNLSQISWKSDHDMTIKWLLHWILYGMLYRIVCSFLHHHHDASPWCIMMMHHEDASWRCIMMMHLHGASSSWCIIIMHHYDASWFIIVIHHDVDASSWCIIMTHYYYAS